MRHCHDADLIGRNALPSDFGAGIRCQCGKARLGLCQRIKPFAKLHFAHGAHVGQSHTKGGQNTCKRMDKDAFHPKRIGHETSMLPACPTKAVHRVFGHVIAALHTDFLDRIGHVFNGNPQETFGNVFNGHAATDFTRHIVKFRTHGIHIQRLVGVRAKNRWKQIRVQFAQQHVAIGHRQRAATAIGSGAGIGASTFGTDLHTPVTE